MLIQTDMLKRYLQRMINDTDKAIEPVYADDTSFGPIFYSKMAKQERLDERKRVYLEILQYIDEL